MSIFNDFENPNFIDQSLDLTPYYCGYEDCSPGYFFGPAIRDHFLIHYILDGKGTFEIGDRVFRLSKGQGFLICPGVLTYYKADNKKPWDYTWVGFHGINAAEYLRKANLSNNNPIFEYSLDNYITELFSNMVETNDSHNKNLKLTGLLYLLLHHLIQTTPQTNCEKITDSRMEFYVKSTIGYISMNYSRNVSIEEIAKHIGLSRKYLSHLFSKSIGMPPQKYLLKFRINKACELINNRSLNIGDISRSVGYEDPLLFSKMFKQIMGMSPKSYREKMQK
jgi:AraC-like DNA-binding protein